MDDRQSKIQVGAGLQESRLNTDLIQWLERYSSWILGILLVVVASYFGWTKYQDMRARQLDQAFVEYTAARGQLGGDGVLSGSPDNMLKIARDHDGQGAIWSLASLDAASTYLGAARRGLRPGTNLAAPTPEDALTPEQSTEMIKTADRLFAEVLARNSGKDRLAPLYLRAALGSATCAISLGEMERARAALTDMRDLATREGFTSQAEEATRRLDELSRLAVAPRLYTDAELPALPTIAPQQLENPNTLIPMPEGFVPPGFDPETQQPIPSEPPAAPKEAPKEEPAPGN
jgi:hypothetical protein